MESSVSSWHLSWICALQKHTDFSSLSHYMTNKHVSPEDRYVIADWTLNQNAMQCGLVGDNRYLQGQPHSQSCLYLQWSRLYFVKPGSLLGSKAWLWSCRDHRLLYRRSYITAICSRHFLALQLFLYPQSLSVFLLMYGISDHICLYKYYKLAFAGISTFPLTLHVPVSTRVRVIFSNGEILVQLLVLYSCRL